MNPAFSVLLFTTLSGAGYGLLCWVALAALAGGTPARPLLLALAAALAACSAGLLASFWHLGKPMRAWRAFSQWRTSWLSREGVLAVLTYLPALLLGAGLLPGMLAADAGGNTARLGVLGITAAVAVIACALATVSCTAMIYASLRPIPAWRHPLVLPGYLLFALLTGGLALRLFPGAAGGLGGALPVALAALAAVLGVLKIAYWRGIDHPMPQRRGDALGLPQRTATVFERPHTEANYITREMGFVVARRHARALRGAAWLLFALAPLLCLLAGWQQPAAAWPLPLAAACALAGAFLERWLFFAEARHMVTLYY